MYSTMNEGQGLAPIVPEITLSVSEKISSFRLQSDVLRFHYDYFTIYPSSFTSFQESLLLDLK